MTHEDVNRLQEMARRADRLLATRESLERMLAVIDEANVIDIQTSMSGRIAIGADLMPTAYPAIRQGFARLSQIVAEACGHELRKLQDDLRKGGAQ